MLSVAFSSFWLISVSFGSFRCSLQALATEFAELEVNIPPFVVVSCGGIIIVGQCGPCDHQHFYALQCDFEPRNEHIYVIF